LSLPAAGLLIVAARSRKCVAFSSSCYRASWSRPDAPEATTTTRTAKPLRRRAHRVRRIVEQLIEHGRVLDSDRAFLGVRVSTTVGGTGRRQQRASPSATSRPDLRSARCRARDDETCQRVPVEIIRGDERRVTLTLTLGELPG
jgi:hypothetical protein